MFSKNELKKMSDDELLREISNIVHGEISDNIWKYEPGENNLILPDFLGGNVKKVDDVYKFNFMGMEFDPEWLILTINGVDIELKQNYTLKNKESRKAFDKVNNTNYNAKFILKNLKKYVKEVENNNSLPVHKLIYNMVEVEESGIKTNDLIQAVKNLLMDAELQKTYNGYVLPLKNNVCKPIRKNEIFEFIEDVCNIRGISNETVKGALSYFNREVVPTFNCIVTANGYYDFEAGRFFEYSDEPIIIKKASPYNYREELIGTEPPAKLKKFLHETFSDDLDKIPQLLEIFGYMLDDGNMYQIMPFFSGKGRNGKGVCLELLSGLVDNNISNVDIFSVEFGSKYSSPLVESDINIINEVKNIKNLAEVKEYIGQGGLHLAKIYEQGRKYEDIELPKTILATNNFKGLGDNVDYALMKRLSVFIEFNNIVPPEKQNPFLIKELKEEEDSFDWLLSNSIYMYQQIRNKGVNGRFMAEHNMDDVSEHLDKYIHPIQYAIKEKFSYDNDKWESLTYDYTGNWDCFVSLDDIKDYLSEILPEVKLFSKNRIKSLLIEAFDLVESRSRHPDDYEGYYVIARPYNSDTKEQKAVVRGILKC